MAFRSQIIADSIAPSGVRLTSIELEYPLIVHNELLTHRTLSRSDDLWLEFSRNSSSNRAIPSKTIEQMILDDPYIPITFRKSTTHMIAGDDLDAQAQIMAKNEWLIARDAAVVSCRYLAKLGVHKQWRNRLLGPFQFITTVATAVEPAWRHFFALRDHEAAQPDIAEIASIAHSMYNTHVPTPLKLGEWHLPYISEVELFDLESGRLDEHKAKQMSVARCARTSYLTQFKQFTIEEDIDLWNRLRTSTPPHASPFEHVAQAASSPLVQSGNFRGWYQYRKILGL